MTKEQALQKIKELEAFVASIPEKTKNDELWEIIETSINKTSSDYKHYWVKDGSEGICVKDDSITIYLPSANTTWYFDTMGLAKNICKTNKFHIYPIGNQIVQNQLTLAVWKKS